MWPENPIKYQLLKETLAPSDANLRDRKLTYWQTDVKNLHFTYELLKYALDHSSVQGERYFERGKNSYREYGLLDDAFRPTAAGNEFIAATESLLAQTPELFEEDVNPFGLEYLLHRLAYEHGARAAYNSVEKIFEILPTLRVNDFDTIVTLVRINNSDDTLRNFERLSPEARKQLSLEVTEILKELKDAGGLNAVKETTRPEWRPFIEALSRGALGHQGDGYYRAAQLLRAQLLLKARLHLRAEGPASLEELYDPFRRNVSRESFSALLQFDPQIKEEGGVYSFSEEAAPGIRPISEVGTQLAEEAEVQRIESQTLELSDEEKRKRILKHLQEAEGAPIVTVPTGSGRQRSHEVRHVRNPKTSAALRLYFNNVCQLCGFDGSTEYGAGFSEVDHALDEIADVQNNRPSNLVVLCPNCHEAKTKGLLVFSDGGDHFIVRNVHTGTEQNIPKFVAPTP